MKGVELKMIVGVIYYLVFGLYIYTLYKRLRMRESEKTKVLDITDFLITMSLFGILGLMVFSSLCVK